MSIESIKSKYEDKLMELPNVNIVGVGKKGNKEVIKVFVTHKVPLAQLKPEEVIPKDLDGIEVDVEESGVVMAQDEDQN